MGTVGWAGQPSWKPICLNRDIDNYGFFPGVGFVRYSKRSDNFVAGIRVSIGLKVKW